MSKAQRIISPKRKSCQLPAERVNNNRVVKNEIGILSCKLRRTGKEVSGSSLKAATGDRVQKAVKKSQ